jgi:REP element-mobilizing transposase RayT
MKFDPQKHHRRSIRLQGYDYSQAGAYYVTIVTWQREHLFGEVLNAEMKLNRFGQIVQYGWYDLPKHYPHVELDTFCIMPNHVHAIIVLTNEIVIKRHPLSEIVRAFKSFSARRINSLRKTQGIPVWQRNYYEHIIRDEKDLQAKCDYILNNPRNWENDDENIKR